MTTQLGVVLSTQPQKAMRTENYKEFYTGKTRMKWFVCKEEKLAPTIFNGTNHIAGGKDWFHNCNYSLTYTDIGA